MLYGIGGEETVAGLQMDSPNLLFVAMGPQLAAYDTRTCSKVASIGSESTGGGAVRSGAAVSCTLSNNGSIGARVQITTFQASSVLNRVAFGTNVLSSSPVRYWDMRTWRVLPTDRTTSQNFQRALTYECCLFQLSLSRFVLMAPGVIEHCASMACISRRQCSQSSTTRSRT
jgi:hypothetical protein